MEIILLLLNFIAFTWWIWAFLIFFPAFRSLWLFYRQSAFVSAINWSLLELRMPRETKRSARAMEQVLTSIHSLRNSPESFKEKYLDGQITRWFSLEVVSFGGEIHFYIRTPEQFKTLIQAPIFSYYPDVEVVDVEDYVEVLPKNTAEMYARDLDIWGTELILAKEAAYPIKTYSNFEGKDENNFDPIATLLEVLGKLKKEEMAAVQINIVPKDKAWRDEFLPELNKLKDLSKGGGKKDEIPKLKFSFESGILPTIQTPDQVPKTETTQFPILTPGLTRLIGAVEDNLTKPAFDTIMRIMYMGPKAAFYDSFIRQGVTGSFNQYAALDLNAFKGNSNAGTKVMPNKFPYVFVRERTEYRKQRFLYNFRRRKILESNWIGKVLTSYLLNFNTHSKYAVLNTESLATLFHIPTQVVLTAPHIKRVESRKVGPPAGIAIFGEGEEIDRYQ